MKPYNARILSIPMPDSIRHLPVSAEGYPVPWFVETVDGVPDFRVIARGRLAEARTRNRCWICGGSLGRFLAFTIGPMCAINRTISEPPSHRKCACFAVMACPFLANPRMRRNEKNLPTEIREAPGEHIKRNPGAVAVWIARDYQPFDAQGGTLFRIGEPTEVLWFVEGRMATRSEVWDSIISGLPLLARAAAEDPRPEAAKRALEESVHRAVQYLPEV